MSHRSPVLDRHLLSLCRLSLLLVLDIAPPPLLRLGLSRLPGGPLAAAAFAGAERRALARQVLGVQEPGADEIQASEDLRVVREAVHVPVRKTAAQHFESLAAVPVADRATYDTLRHDVNRGFEALVGRTAAASNTAWKVRETPPGGKRTILVDTYDAAQLEKLQHVFSRFVQSA